MVVIIPSKYLLCIEMKKQKAPPSAVRPEQTEWLKELAKIDGIRSFVCRGYEEAKQTIEKCMGE